jgi:hypothetical protein
MGALGNEAELFLPFHEKHLLPQSAEGNIGKFSCGPTTANARRIAFTQLRRRQVARS